MIFQTFDYSNIRKPFQVFLIIYEKGDKIIHSQRFCFFRVKEMFDIFCKIVFRSMFNKKVFIECLKR